MESSETVKQQISKIVANQLKSKNPPETKQTFERLKDLGYSKQDAKMLIGQCAAVELFKIFDLDKPFDIVRYVSNLNKLPKQPLDE